MRVRLTKDYKNTDGFSYKAGQIGIRRGPVLQDMVIVELDGYEKSKQRDKEQKDKTGEGFNVVDYAGFFPVEILEEA